MRALTLHNRFQYNSTLIENDFIDHYMVKANGEYVKVYLLLLRYLNTPDCSLTISSLADRLECTEKDISRALNYWANEGLLQIDYDEHQSICSLSMGIPMDSSRSDSSRKSDTDNLNLSKTDLSDVSASKSDQQDFSSELSSKKPTLDEQIQAAQKKSTSKASENSEELKQLYFVAEQYMGKPLSISEIQKINYFFDYLHFSADLIEYLIEYCVENGHRNMRYIESVAHAWADAKISSVTDAKANSASYHKNCFAVLNTFGIKGRNPAPVEVSYIKKWTEEYGFTLDIITEACSRTIAHTSKPDFKYADSILKNWFEKKVHHMADVLRLDQIYQQGKLNAFHKKASVKRPPVKSASTNRFNNFEGRSYDISSLEQQLLNTP